MIYQAKKNEAYAIYYNGCNMQEVKDFAEKYAKEYDLECDIDENDIAVGEYLVVTLTFSRIDFWMVTQEELEASFEPKSERIFIWA